MDGGEKNSRKDETDAGSEWDVLRPENNGIGEFNAAERTEEAESAQATSSVGSEGLEVDPDIIDAHVTKRAWDPGSTDVILCNVLDEEWYPDVDDERPDSMTIEERFEELRDREQFLDGLENHRLHPNPNDAWKYDGIDQTVANFRDIYLEYLDKLKQHPGEPSYETMAKNAHNMLVTVRTYQFLASDPKRRRAEIEYDRAGLSMVLAKRDGRYEAAFEKVDNDEIQERMDKLIDKIPQRSFRKLAKSLPPGEPLNETYINNVAKVVLRALGLDASEVEYVIDDSLGEYLYGVCRNLGEGKSRVLINTNTNRASGAAEGGNTVAHETLHALQHKIQYVNQDNSLGEFYQYCSDYYVPAQFDYDKYVTQYIEAEAFYFGNEFGKRIEAAQDRLNRWPHKILSKVKRGK